MREREKKEGEKERENEGARVGEEKNSSGCLEVVCALDRPVHSSSLAKGSCSSRSRNSLHLVRLLPIPTSTERFPK